MPKFTICIFELTQQFHISMCKLKIIYSDQNSCHNLKAYKQRTDLDKISDAIFANMMICFPIFVILFPSTHLINLFIYLYYVSLIIIIIIKRSPGRLNLSAGIFVVQVEFVLLFGRFTINNYTEINSSSHRTGPSPVRCKA